MSKMKTSLKNEVIDWLDTDNNSRDEQKDMLEDLQEHGCISGMIPGLTMYVDTVAFYEKYKKQILEMVDEYCQETGMDLKAFLQSANNFPLDKKELERESFVRGISGLMTGEHSDIADQVKNWLSWFAFEETANQYYSQEFEK